VIILNLVILKAGGSAVTEKTKNKLKAKPKVIRRLAKEIKKAKSKKKFNLILVHGAGPFGHTMVKNYKVNNGVKTKRHVEGFVRTHNACEDLNKTFADIFREEGLLGFPIQTSACITTNNKKIKTFDTTIIKKLLQLDENVIPILYGDMVIDSKLKGVPLSGDAIIPFLAHKLKARKVLLGSDVQGIFDADPKKNKRAKLIKKINNSNFSQILKKVGAASTVDVTGGMRGKLQQLRKRLKGVNAVIFDLNKKDNAFNLLTGARGIGTEISFK
jgi:isopentenyl phosphate kinase